MNKHTKIELLEAVFSIQSGPILYSEPPCGEGKNTSKVALRVVGGEEKRIHCLGV
jgi:hypothetical protein